MRDSARAALRALHHRCVGCENQGRPGRSGRPNLRHERWGNRRRRSRRRGAATANEWRAVRPEPRAVVRSTLPQAEAAVPALVRALLHGAVRSEVRACSAGAPARVQRAKRRAVPRPSRRRCSQPAQPARASEARTAMSAARSAGARRTRRWSRRWCRTLRRPCRTGSGGERQRAAGQAERAVSEANGGARDTRPKGRDRAAGSAG